MKFKENYLVFILFFLVMLSLGSVAASENVTSDEISNNDFVSLSVYSTLEVENDDVNTQETENEVSLETNNKKTRSSRDVLKVSNNSPLRADPTGQTFADIQTAINKTSAGETVFLNGKNYTGNQLITIDRDITIDGASKSNSSQVSILDANGTYGIFNSSKHNVVLKNLIFENPDLSVTGYCAYFGKGGNLTIQNVTIRNIKGTTNYRNAICLGAGSTVNANNLTFNYNSISYNSTINGILLRTGQSSNVTMSNLNIYDNNISASNILRGFVFVGNSSSVNMSNLNIYNNNISAQNNIYGSVKVDILSEINIANVNFYNNYFEAKQNIEGIFLLCSNSTAICSDLTFENNKVLNYTQFRSFVRANINSTLVLNNVYSKRNYMSGMRTVGATISVIDTNISLNYCYIEDNCINNSYNRSKVGINQAGFISIQGRGIVNQCHSLNNYVNDAFGGIIRIQTLNGYTMSYLENSTFVNTTLGAADISLDIFNPSDHGGVLCVEGQKGVTVGTLIHNCSFINNCNSLGGAITPHNHCIVENCTFINNTATKYYGGAISTFYGNLTNLTTDREITVKDCYFEGNAAPLGGAIQANGDDVNIYGCTFVNNTACKGGAVFLFGNTIDLHNCSFSDNVATDDIPGVLVGKLDWGIFDWNVEGGAVYIYGNSSDLHNNTFRYNEAIGKNSDGCGGAIYVYGDNSTIDKTHFDDNFAHGGNGSAINIYGIDTTVKNSEFFNHDSVIGTVYIIGNMASVLNSTFEHNNASRGGGAVYIEGNSSKLDNNTFNDNNATVHGGAVHIMGNNANISNSNFLNNNAIPHPTDIEQGLGGAIFIKGNYNYIIRSLFDGNTARNGSAIYNRGHHVHIDDDKFLENQAFSYLLKITVTPKVSYYTGSNQVLINVTLVGGDNIINAIYNDGIPKNMYFHNVTYEHSLGNRTTTDNETHPVDGAENSQGGKLLYQDPREDYQNVTLSVFRDKSLNSRVLMAPAGVNGDLILDGMYKTGLYGNISILLSDNLTSGDYSVYSEHPEDRLYKQIDNSTKFRITPQADLEIIKKVSNSTPNYKDEIEWTITVINHGPSGAENVIVNDKLPDGLVYLSDDSFGEYNSTTGVWKIGDLAHNEDAIIVIRTLVNITNATITNVAVVKSDTYDPNETNNEDNDTITVGPFADLAIEKIVSKHGPKMGDNITWTIRVTNNGPDTAVNAFVRDVLPDGLKFIGSDGNYANNVWRIGDMAKGDTAVLKIETQVLVTDAVIINVANVTSDTPDPDLTNNEDNATVDVGHEADLAIVKVVSNSTPKFGDVITWTITVTNNGPDRAIDVFVNDTLPNGLVYVSDDSNGDYDSVSGIWTIGLLQNKASVTLNIRSLVNISNATITNVAVVDSDTYDPNETNNKDNDTITVNPYADLAIEKIVSNHGPKMGDNITWTIRVTNNGPDTAVNAFVRDILPTGLIYLSDDGKGNYTNNIWNIGNMTSGATAVLHIVTQVDVDEAVITNVANVTSDTPEYDLTNNEDNATIDVGHEADLAIVKVVSNSTPRRGDNITWTITVTNNGPDRAIDVVVYDTLPKGLVYVSDDSNGDYDNLKGVWTIGIVQYGASVTLNIITLVDISNANITNVANVTSDTYDPDLSNNVDNDSIEVPHEADLEITKVVSNSTPEFNSIVVWTISVFNHGPDSALNVIVRDMLPDGLVYVSDDGDGKYNHQTGLWNIGELHHGRGLILNIQTLVNVTNSTIVNVASVNSTTYDPNETNNKDNDTITVNPYADLAIDKTVNPHYPKAGDVVTWIITVTNNGPDTAVNAFVRDVLPAGLEFIESDGNYTNNVWYIGDMANGATAVLNIKTRILVTDAVITNVANVTSDTPDLDLTNNEDNATVDIGHEADLAIVKVVSNPNPRPGEIITWTITVTNNGPDRAIDVAVYDVLPKGLEFIESDGAFSDNMWYVGVLANGDTAVLNIKTKVLVSDAVITNIANVTSDTHDSNLTNNVGNDTIVVHPQADISIVKEANTAKANIHDIVVWTITLTNNGPDVAENVVVNDKLPSGLKLLFARADVGSYENGVWSVGSLNNGEVVTLKLITEVTILNGTIKNIVNAETSSYDPNKDNNNDSEIVTVIQIVDLGLKIDSNKQVLKVGDEFIWTITVINYGPNVAINTVVTYYVTGDVKFIKYAASKGTVDPSRGIWKIGDLDMGEQVTLKLVYKALGTGIARIYANTSCDLPEISMANNNDTSVVKIIPNETNPKNKTDIVKNESTSSSNPLTVYQTGNPIALVILALLSVVFVRLKRE